MRSVSSARSDASQAARGARGRAVELPGLAVAGVAALGGDDHVVAAAAQRLGDQPLVVADVGVVGRSRRPRCRSGSRPASSAAWIVRIERSSGGRPQRDMGMAPRPIGKISVPASFLRSIMIDLLPSPAATETVPRLLTGWGRTARSRAHVARPRDRAARGGGAGRRAGARRAGPRARPRVRRRGAERGRRGAGHDRDERHPRVRRRARHGDRGRGHEPRGAGRARSRRTAGSRPSCPARAG